MINTQTRLTALLGCPIAHSYSPVMHNAAFRKLKLNCEYLPIECGKDALGDVVTGLRRMNFAGFNVTMPLKQEVIQYLDAVDERAQIYAAVNTVKKDGDKLIGYNTDGAGFIDSLAEAGFGVNGRRFLIIGAGGSTRALAAALALSGAEKVMISSRRMEQAASLARQLSEYAGNCDAVALDGDIRYDCIINASGVGMHPDTDKTPIDKSLLRREALVCDLTYNPAKTQFLMDAEEIGAPILNGLGMFIYQGVRAFEIWFNIPAPVDEMRTAVETAMTGGCK